jgi:uroporphyrin-3 C-methyltransferase
MAASGPENIISSPPGDPSQGRRAHTYSRLTTAIAVLGLAAAIYALIRTDSIRDKLDVANQTVVAANADKELLRAELKSQASRERQAHRDLNRRLDELEDAPQQLQELASSVEELRGRAEGPERAWSRA